MMNKFSFFKKEVKEIVKTHKIIVLPAIMLFFGLTSPLFAKFMNMLLEPALKKEGIDPTAFMKEPVLLDSYMQLFSNFTQIVLISVILVFMGIVVDEKVKGSAILVLTKSVSRSQFIISKFISSVLLFTVSYVLSVAAFAYYTYILFSKFLMDNTFLSLFMLWLLGVFMISIAVFASTISKTHIIAAVSGFAGYALTMAVSAIPYVKDYSPGIIGGLALELLKGVKPASDALGPIVVTMALCVVFLGGSVAVFRRREL